MQAIARGLTPAHDVYLTDGGRPVPRRPSAREPLVVPLPRLFRAGGRLCAGEPGVSVDATLAERARRLGRAVERIRPDFVLIDHYPFSKWELEGEMTALIAAARHANPAVQVVGSLRDIVRQTRHEAVAAAPYAERVLALVGAGFDALLIHADPAFTRLEEHFPRAADLPVPRHYTGFVLEPMGRGPAPSLAAPYAVLSCGGGTRSLSFLLAAIEAFARVHRAGTLGPMPLVVFPGPFLGAPEREALQRATKEGPFQLRAFTPDFDRWLAGSALSISRAGYNTSVRILSGQIRSVLVPDPDMSDQDPRARRFAERGLATVVAGAVPTVEAIAGAIEVASTREPKPHGLDLGGVETTRSILEALGAREAVRIRAGSATAAG
jgi:predicted glycosyltransferase